MTEKNLTLGTNLDTNAPFHISSERLATKKGFILGQSEAGKTWATAVVVEGMMDLGITTVVFDLIDMWSGLALDREGKKPAYPIAIFGGKRGHYRLAPDMGSAIARTIYAKRWSTVINLSGMTEEEQYRVTADIVRKTFELHEDQPRRTVFVFEEFHRFVPETLTTVKNHALVRQEIVRVSDMGRNLGLGMLGIELRPQDVMKRILGQADWRLWMKMNELGAIDTARKYLTNATDAELGKEYAAQLPRLNTGTGFFESPSWMKVVAPVRVGARKTFHRDPESDFVMDDAMIAQAVDVVELKRVFSKFQTSDANEPEARRDDNFDTTPRTANVKAKTQHNVERSETEVKHLLRETEKELAALRAAYDELKEQYDELEADVQQRIRLAEQAATREVTAQMNQMRSTIAQTLPMLQGLVGVEAESGKPAIIAPMNKLLKLQRQIEEHPRLKSSHKKIMQVLFEEYPDFPNGMSRAKLASAVSMKLSSLERGGYLSELKDRKYIVLNGDIVAINPEML